MRKKPVDCPSWFNQSGTQWFLTASDKAFSEKNEYDSFNEVIESFIKFRFCKKPLCTLFIEPKWAINRLLPITLKHKLFNTKIDYTIP